jgi:YgiT-type zinc finger domain-containing protein
MGERFRKEEGMKCVLSRNGETSIGKTTVTLERDRTVLVIRAVPAQVCQNCGEAYVDEAITDELLQVAEQAVRSGIQVDVRDYIAA